MPYKAKFGVSLIAYGCSDIGLTHSIAEFDIPELKDIAWNKDAFGNLVLPEAEKSLLLAMVDPDESIKSMTFDDFITGKGE